jgi:hypothetical protein
MPWRSQLSSASDFVDRWVKRASGLVAALAVIAFFVPPAGNAIKLVTSWRFGAVGFVKYELGSRQNEPGKIAEGEPRYPTYNGQLYLLRNGKREYKNIHTGDIVQAITAVNFREDGKCALSGECGSAPTVFVLEKGDCAIVISRAYPDNGKDDGWPSEDEKKAQRKKNPDWVPGPVLVDKNGGWLRVATTACGLFS